MHATAASLLERRRQVSKHQPTVYNRHHSHEFDIRLHRAKWDAYNALGKMPADRAMELYVDELKKIIETMSYTDNVAEFMGSVGELGAVDIGDLEAVAPEAIKTVRSRPNSPFASRESSPVRAAEPSSMATAVLGGGSLHDEVGQMLLSNGYHSDEYTNGHSATDYSDDEYIDTVEVGLLNVNTRFFLWY